MSCVYDLMEHDFIYLSDSRRYLLKLPSEQHALQRFLLDEFEPRAQNYQALITVLQQLGPFDEWQWQGSEYLLTVQQREVRVSHHSLGYDDANQQLPDDELTMDDSSLMSECGLEDLLELLLAWQQFLPK